VLATFNFSVGVSKDGGWQRIVVMAIAIAHVAAKKNRGMIQHRAVGFLGGFEFLDQSGKFLRVYF